MLIRILFPVALSLAGLAAAPGAAQAMQRQDHAEFPRAGFERVFRTTPAGLVLAALERNYPDDARALMDRLYDLAYAHRADIAGAGQLAAAELIAMLRSKSADLANAPAPDLRRVLQLRLALYQTLQREDVALCGRLSVAAPGSVNTLPVRFASMVSPGTAAMIDAAGAGRRGPRLAGRGRPSRGDISAWRDSIKALDRDGELTPLLRDPAALQAAAPALQCRLGIIAYESALSLPLETSGNVAAFLLLLELGVVAQPEVAAAPAV